MTKRLLSTAFFVLVLPAAAVQGPLPCEGGLAGNHPCRSVDQASFVPLNDLSGDPHEVAGEVLGWHHEESGREFALVSLRTRTSVVEVTDPESPRVVGDFGRDVPGGLGDMAIFEDHLYAVVNREGPKLDIFDLTRLLGVGPPVSFPPDASLTLDGFGGLSINPETGFAYVFSGAPFHPGQIVAFDLNNDPENPAQVFAWDPGPAYPSNLECVIYRGADQRFVGHEICFGAGSPRSLVIYDVTDKANPVRLSRTFYRPFNNPWHTALTADHRFLLLADSHDEHSPGYRTRTFLWNLSSLTAPVNFTRYDGPTRARDLHLEVRGRYAFLANATAGVRILDLRQIARGRVREVGSFDVEPTLNNTNWFGAYSLDVLPSGIVIVGSVRQGLYVLRPRL